MYKLKYTIRILALVGILLVFGTTALAASEKSIPEQISLLREEIVKLMAMKEQLAQLQETINEQQKQINELRKLVDTAPKEPVDTVTFKTVSNYTGEQTPLSNIRVVVNDAIGNRYTMITGEDGLVKFDLPPGQYWYTYEALDENGNHIEISPYWTGVEGTFYLDKHLYHRSISRWIYVPMKP
ncbi:carboxypeptidase regulatory-like domain-containing protein [Paenibacillus caseinilyticus]|uniref:Uncharacterized protein n=1 Tax=Paenibacillus mucilaginosus K02 TaxID=997761 RepID=I0BE03_9BACL|nr:hypothetical protein [Paenibacillus mucilaginosus]AFH60600.1 hypothetical protein B2K_07670 [Paenibacillus mucilaginosus K02]